MKKLLPFLSLSLFLSQTFVAHAQTLDGVAAIVNDAVITKSELNKQVKIIEQQMAQSHAPQVEHAVLEKQVLEHLILKEVQLQVAKRSGIQVEEFALDNAISKIAEQNNLSVSDLRQTLIQQNIDFSQYRNTIRDQIMISQLYDRDLSHDIHISDQEIKQFIQANTGPSMNEEYRLGHILISLPESPTPEQLAAANEKADKIIQALDKGEDFSQLAIKESSGETALKGGDLGWRKLPELPTLFVQVVPTLKINDISEPIRSASGLHIIKLTDKKQTKQQDTAMQKTQVRHILIKTNTMVSDNEAKQRLTTLRKKILAGEDFGKIAKTHSADLGSANNGGSLGWVTSDVLVPEFSNQMSTLAINEISEPFKTSFGWHIMQVLDRKAQSNQDAMLQQKAREMIRQRKLEEKQQLWSRQLRDEAYVVTYFDKEKA